MPITMDRWATSLTVTEPLGMLEARRKKTRYVSYPQQFEAENHLRWDSLGEFLALCVSLDDIAAKSNNPRAKVLAGAPDTAIAKLLLENKSPSRKTGEIDNRGSHYYLGMYWAEALVAQNEDPELRDRFAPVARALTETENEAKINEELILIQGKAMDIGGYYHPDHKKAEEAMRPSATLDAILASI